MDYLLCGLLILGLAALFGILVSACVLVCLLCSIGATWMSMSDRQKDCRLKIRFLVICAHGLKQIPILKTK